MPKTHAFGTTLSWDAVVVAALDNIGGIEITVDTVEVTTHDSPDGYKEYIAGLLDAGEISIGGFFEPTDTTGQQAMLTDMAARAIKQVIITFPASTKATWTFQGLITAIKIGDAPKDDAIPFTASIKPTGKPVFAITA